MENNIIDTKSVKQLVRSSYFIPSYQRGYRWEKQQVIDLMDDILDYQENAEKGSYYCLQPIVVKAMSDQEKQQYNLDEDKTWYEVIDGQQRLTTIAILRHYFNLRSYDKKKEFVISYETRQTLVDKITEEQPNEIDNIDLYHAQAAYNNIKAWISNKDDDDSFRKATFEEVFENDVKVIWYEVNNVGSDPIELFTRINMGKIPLTNAELIKALFLRKRNFESNKELRQIEIAKEWDGMEYALQNDDFWYFLNKEGENKPARIEYLFDMMYEQAKKLSEENGRLEAFYQKFGIDDYKTFRFFVDKFKNASTNAVKDCWEDVQGCFSALKEWFDDPVYYHYIGYLITCGVSIVEIYNMYDKSPKDEFLQKLKVKIHEIVGSVHYTIEDGVVSFNLSYVNNKELIRKLLLLFNIQYMILHNSKSDHWYIRFPFDLYKKQKWDIEHINSFTTYEITKGEEQINWIETALEDLKNLGVKLEDTDPILYSDIEKFIANTENKLFPGIKQRIARYAGEDVEEDETVKNNIGNLTLLNAEINRGYGNSLFVTKRREIINRDKEGCFIPICTKNIFLKYYDTEGSSKTIWSKANGDHNKYLSEIKDTLSEFITNEVE